MRLDGKVALIPCAASGIGREAARLFAREGARVVVVDVEANAAEGSVAMVTGDGGYASPFVADVARSADCAAMIAHAEVTFGRLDVLFNDARIMDAADDDA